MRAPFVLLAVCAVVVVGVLLLNTSGGQYVVRTEFADANGLAPGFSVREDGVVVGSVSGVAVTPRDTALVTLHLDPAAVPIGAGASVSIHPSNLLGEKYVQLDPGNVSRPQPSGTLIPRARTSAAPELDEVLDAFDPDTRRAAAIFLAEQGNALLSRGADLGRLLSALPPSLASGRQLVAGLAHDNRALGLLIDESDRILAAAAPQRAALGRLVSSAGRAFSTLAGREQALGDTVAAAPGTLSQLRTTLVALERAAGPLSGAARGLRIAAPSLAQTLGAVPGFVRAATPTLASLTAAAPALDRLARVAPPVLGALEPTSSALAGFSSALRPVSRLLDGSGGTILDVLQGWARAIADRDGVGHMYRIETVLPATTLQSLLDTAGGSVPARGASAPAASQRAPRPRHTPSHHQPAGAATPAPATAPAAAAPPPAPPPATPAPPASNVSSTVSSLLHFLLK